MGTEGCSEVLEGFIKSSFSWELLADNIFLWDFEWFERYFYGQILN